MATRVREPESRPKAEEMELSSSIEDSFNSFNKAFGLVLFFIFVITFLRVWIIPQLFGMASHLAGLTPLAYGLYTPLARLVPRKAVGLRHRVPSEAVPGNQWYRDPFMGNASSHSLYVGGTSPLSNMEERQGTPGWGTTLFLSQLWWLVDRFLLFSRVCYVEGDVVKVTQVSHDVLFSRHGLGFLYRYGLKGDFSKKDVLGWRI
ncbi:hypothetical protein Dimus_035992 [Dionaea muscipula]